ncbi:MAG: KGK domain-containing protein [Heteroscytonema crispum UTEX LB 1556]
MEIRFESLSDDDVISVNAGKQNIIAHTTFKVSEFTRQMVNKLTENDNQRKWFFESADCQVLKPGVRGWQNGKIRFSLQFCPDEPESPLDDIRQQLK